MNFYRTKQSTETIKYPKVPYALIGGEYGN